MSIRKMISLHPKATNNQALGDAVHHLMYCAKMCLSCADACAAEKMDMAQCIRSCLDCADVCEACAAECEKHDHEHCKLCAQICRECAEDCRKAALSLA